MEIERKFLIQDAPFGLSEHAEAFEIEQGYFLTDVGTKMRVRSKTNVDGDVVYVQTRKEGDGLVREEDEWEISKEAFEAIWPDTEGKRLQKTRYLIPHESLVVELDVYHGPLEGLMTAEVEFESVDEAMAFEVPRWFGKELTDDHRFTNAELATNTEDLTELLHDY